jgi:hypothetical protein
MRGAGVAPFGFCVIFYRKWHTICYGAEMRIGVPQRLCHFPLVMDVLLRSQALDAMHQGTGQHSLINPMIIHSLQRMEAIGFRYCLGLMVWNVIWRTVRLHVKKTKTGLPCYRNKPSDNITTSCLFELFPHLQTLVVVQYADSQRE